MKIDDINVQFTETAEEEVAGLVHDLRLVPIASYLASHAEPVPLELKQMVTDLLIAVTELLSIELPGIASDPETTLRLVSRDINLARLLRERGMFRLYRLINTRVWVNRKTGAIGYKDDGASDSMLLYQTKRHPQTGDPFSTREDFIGWFCEEAHVARSLVFMRLSAISRMTTLGFSLEESFQTILKKPYVIQETLRDGALGNWKKGDLISVDPALAVSMAKKTNASNLGDIERLAKNMTDNPSPEAMGELADAMLPVMAGLVREVADHDRAGEAMDYIKHDILSRPEIRYYWEDEGPALIVEFIRRQYNAETGEEITSSPIRIPFVPDSLALPEEIRKDLLERLPIKNKPYLDP